MVILHLSFGSILTIVLSHTRDFSPLIGPTSAARARATEPGLAKDSIRKMEQVVIFIAGCLVTCLITHVYYWLSSTTVPQWAKELVEHFPKQRPTGKELLALFQQYLDTGKIEIDPLLRRVACPECGQSAKRFERKAFGNDSTTIVVISCPACGWSEDVQV